MLLPSMFYSNKYTPFLVSYSSGFGQYYQLYETTVAVKTQQVYELIVLF